MWKTVEVTEMTFYREMLRIPWPKHASKDEVDEEMETKRKFKLSIRKRHFKFLGHIINKYVVEDVIASEQTEPRWTTENNS